jgi:hypothetical protein
MAEVDGSGTAEIGRNWHRWQAVKRLTNSNKRQTADLIQSRRSEYDRPTASPQ